MKRAYFYGGSMKTTGLLVITLSILNCVNAATTIGDPKVKNIQIKDAYVDDRGVTIMKIKYQSPDGPTPNPSFIVADTFMCFKSSCYQMESNGREQLTNEGKFYDVVGRFILDNTKKRAIYSVNLEDGSTPSLECPSFKKTLKNVSSEEIKKLTADIHSGKIVLNSLPEEASAPKFYYEDADKNIIYVDETEFKIPSSYRYYEGKAEA